VESSSEVERRRGEERRICLMENSAQVAEEYAVVHVAVCRISCSAVTAGEEEEREREKRRGDGKGERGDNREERRGADHWLLPSSSRTSKASGWDTSFTSAAANAPGRRRWT